MKKVGTERLVGIGAAMVAVGGLLCLREGQYNTALFGLGLASHLGGIAIDAYKNLFSPGPRKDAFLMKIQAASSLFFAAGVGAAYYIRDNIGFSASFLGVFAAGTAYEAFRKRREKALVETPEP